MNSIARPLSRLILAAQNYLADRTSRHMVIVLAGHVLRLGLGILSSAALARGLGPSDLGTFSVLSAVMMIAVTIGDFGLSNSAVRFVAADLNEDPGQAQATARVFAGLKLLGSLVVVGVSLALAGPIAALLSLPAEIGPPLVRLAALGVLATSASGVLSTIFQALKRFSQLIGIQTLNVSLTVLFMGALFLSNRLTIASALWVGVVTALAAVLLGWWLLPAGWRAALSTWGSLRSAEGRRLLTFSRWLWVSAILSILSAQLDLILLNQWLAPALVGIYALALNLSHKVRIVNQTLHTVLLPTVSALSTREEYVDYIRRSLIRSLMLAVPVALTVVLARPFILFVYGAPYAGSVGLFRLLILLTVFELLVDPVLLLAFPMNMPRLLAAAEASRVAVLFIVGVFAIPAWGLNGAIVAKFAASICGALVKGVAIIHHLQTRPPAPVADEKSPDRDIVPARRPPGST